jgi:hypothetical protein
MVSGKDNFDTITEPSSKENQLKIIDFNWVTLFQAQS